MLMIRHPFQARCDDRTKVLTVVEQPLEWIQTALGATQSLLSFHFLVSWVADPPRIAGPLWLTRLLMASHDQEIATATEAQVRAALDASDVSRCLAPLSSFAARLGAPVECVLLPEYSRKAVDADSPVWRLLPSESGALGIRVQTVQELSEEIRTIRGVDAALGSKGLIYGTSAVECLLSRSGNIFPGDCDGLILDAGAPQAIVELKKHTLPGPIGENLASRYYPVPDGRKFDALAALQRQCQSACGRDVPIAVVYYATRFKALRIQIISIRDNAMRVERDSGDVVYQDVGAEKIGARIVRYVTR